MGRSRGGFSPNRHAGGLDAKTRVAFALTRGARQEAPACEMVGEPWPALPHLAYGVMANADDRARLRPHLQEQEVTPVMPPKQNRKHPVVYEAEPYQ
ncbi:MAG TPA: hypothetical protein VEO53_05035 [Candidatus Binatia bacterium]|nr:hypothetical protein [Candidatus Binatia bacterium]